MLPENVDFGADILSGYSRNTFRIEPNSASTGITAGRIIQITLPENSVLDMKSLRMFAKVTCKQGETDISNILGVLPANTESLISSIEVFVNGVQVTQNSNEYNTICKVLKLGSYNQDAQLTTGNLVNHSKMMITLPDDKQNIFGDNSMNGEVADICIDNWSNFLGTGATRFLPTDVLGSIVVRLTLAPNSVLSGVIDTPGQKIFNAALDNATKAPHYELDKPYFTIDSCVLPDSYNELLRRRLSQDEYLPLNYKEYYTFITSGIAGQSYSNRFALSSGCINSLHAVQRYDSHNVFGAATDLEQTSGERAPVGTTGSTAEGKYFTYKTFKAGGDYLDGEFKYQFNINNVANPQFLAGNKFAMANLPFVNNKLTPRTQGIVVGGETAFCQGQAVYTCMLSHPDMSSKVMSGLNSRGINSQFYFSAQGLDKTQVTHETAITSLVVVDTTAQIRISAGRQCSVIW